MTGSVRVRWVVSGRVQGVGYRRFVERLALHLGLAGWVRNRSDGAVEIEVEGPQGTIESLRADLQQGPPGARVSSVAPVAADPAEPLPMPFTIRRGS